MRHWITSFQLLDRKPNMGPFASVRKGIGRTKFISLGIAAELHSVASPARTLTSASAGRNIATLL
jgi:hypothetical protein